jgi:lysophospholipase L1-like esterase
MSEWLFCNRPELQLRFHITAVGGSALRDVMKRYEPMIKPMRPDWLVLTISANDQAQQVPLKDFAAQADELCGKLTADSGGRVVWVDTGPPPGETEERRAARDSYRKAMADAVARHKGITVPVEDVLLRKGAALAESWSGHTIGTGADGHLNIIGAEIVSTQVLQALGVLTVNE